MCPPQSQKKEIHDIDKLNNIVRTKVKKYVADAKENNTSKFSPEIEAVLSGEVIVYQKRLTWIPIFWSLFALFLLYTQFEKPTYILFAGFVMFIWYDFFSGLLHIVLDNPDFIGMILLGPPCLEFQWHHHIPKDLASKSFLQTCGDLNVVVGILCGIYLGAFQIRNPIGICLVAFKLIMAYFGQYCHCMAHTNAPDRPKWVHTFQSFGLMISPADHGIHHQTYDDNFCIGSGLCNPLITWLLKNVTTNKWFWLISFLLGASLDVPVFNHILTKYVGFE
mmetsp:Transcript_16769/g.21767  ORF Transcript_16769/g.21767 Transcript_16769/m.21767 type:complete len:278 (+) Transcript_16769:82-915(+)